jgi:endoglucanase
MTKRHRSLLFVAVTIAFLTLASTAAADNSLDASAAQAFSPSGQSEIAQSRLARLRHGINLSHWFAQSADYSKAHLESHTTAEDFALIKSIGFDHVRLTLEPAPLFNVDDPSTLKAEHLKYLDNALDLIPMQGLAVIVDIHPSDEFKIRLNSNDRQIEAFGKFWRALAQHLSTRDPERVFLEVINEPMVEDGYRWYGMQGKLVSAIRSGAPQHTIIASGHRWSGLVELLFLQPYADRNIIYNFHFYEPYAFTHQGASWAGGNLPFYKNIPYPSSLESVSKILDTIQDEPGPLQSSPLWRRRLERQPH